MGLKKLLALDGQARAGGAQDYIDLEAYAAAVEVPSDAKMRVRVAELHRHDQLRPYLTWVYQGNLLLLDYTPIAQDEATLQKVIADLKAVALEVGGDITGMGLLPQSPKILVVAPAGVKIQRNVQRTA